jgi:hypothetical protein
MVSIEAFKGVALASVFIMAMLGAAVPCVLERRCGSQAGRRKLSQPLQEPGKWTPSRVLGVLNAASAGLFISAGVMHLLAEALENEELAELSRHFWGDHPSVPSEGARPSRGRPSLTDPHMPRVSRARVAGDEHGHGHDRRRLEEEPPDDHDHDELEGAAGWALMLCLGGFFFLVVVEQAVHE